MLPAAATAVEMVAGVAEAGMDAAARVAPRGRSDRRLDAVVRDDRRQRQPARREALVLLDRPSACRSARCDEDRAADEWRIHPRRPAAEEVVEPLRRLPRCAAAVRDLTLHLAAVAKELHTLGEHQVAAGKLEPIHHRPQRRALLELWARCPHQRSREKDARPAADAALRRVGPRGAPLAQARVERLRRINLGDEALEIGAVDGRVRVHHKQEVKRLALVQRRAAHFAEDLKDLVAQEVVVDARELA